MRIFSNVTYLELFIYQFVDFYKKSYNKENCYFMNSLTFFYLNTFLLLALISEKFQLPLFFFIKTYIFNLIMIQELFCRFHLSLKNIKIYDNYHRNRSCFPIDIKN